MWLLNREKSLNGGYSDERKPLLFSLINHIHINKFQIIILVFSESPILVHGGKAGLPCQLIRVKNPPFFLNFNILSIQLH